MVILYCRSFYLLISFINLLVKMAMVNYPADLLHYVSNAITAVEFKLIRDKSDIDDESKVFHPEMAYQIFGDTENIFGFKNLKIRIYYTAGPLQIYFGLKYSDHVDNLSLPSIKADDVLTQVNNELPENCFRNINDFIKTIDTQDNFHPFGEKLVSFDVVKDDAPNTKRTFEIYQCDFTIPEFQGYHERLQSFIKWFIYAASYIDNEDEKWLFLMCYEKYTNSEGKTLYATAGYVSIYRYYAYPQHVRPRISQVLVLPPFQKMGIATKLLESFNNVFKTDKTVVDTSYEDPSDELQRIRSYLDVQLCQDLDAFSVENLRRGFNEDMIKEAKAKGKINAKQCRKVYEIIKFKNLNINNDEDYKNYRLEIKKRLNLVHNRERTDLMKLKKVGVDVTAALAAIPSIQERIEQLKTEYMDVEKDYRRILKRLY